MRHIPHHYLQKTKAKIKYFSSIENFSKTNPRNTKCISTYKTGSNSTQTGLNSLMKCIYNQNLNNHGHTNISHLFHQSHRILHHTRITVKRPNQAQPKPLPLLHTNSNLIRLVNLSYTNTSPEFHKIVHHECHVSFFLVTNHPKSCMSVRMQEYQLDVLFCLCFSWNMSNFQEKLENSQKVLVVTNIWYILGLKIQSTYTYCPIPRLNLRLCSLISMNRRK